MNFLLVLPFACCILFNVRAFARTRFISQLEAIRSDSTDSNKLISQSGSLTSKNASTAAISTSVQLHIHEAVSHWAHTSIEHLLLQHYLFRAKSHIREWRQIPDVKQLLEQLEDGRSERLLPVVCAGLVPLVDAVSTSRDMLAFTIAAESVVKALQQVLHIVTHKSTWARALSIDLHHVRHALNSLHAIQHPDGEHLPHERSALRVLGDECRLQESGDKQSLALGLQVEDTLDRLFKTSQQHLSTRLNK